MYGPHTQSHGRSKDAHQRCFADVTNSFVDKQFSLAPKTNRLFPEHATMLHSLVYNRCFMPHTVSGARSRAQRESIALSPTVFIYFTSHEATQMQEEAFAWSSP